MSFKQSTASDNCFTMHKLLYTALCMFIHYGCCYVYVFDDSRGLGRKFDGIGAISGGGATSKLLVNYPQKQRDEIFDYLFKPNFGAAIHLLKVEIGGDTQSTEGAEASHMHSPDELNFERGYEWWFMLEAKKRNPDLKLIGLPWGFPGWVGGTSGDIFANPKQTAMYIVYWILGAKHNYGLHIDYIGIWNESRYTTQYIKILRQMLDQHSLNDTLIVAADDIRDWDEISSQVLADPELADAIYAIGVHYPGTNSSVLALDTGKPLWASEDPSTDLYLRWNLNYVNGFISGTVMWPVLSAFYMGLPYNGVGLLNASEPWSGHYRVPVNLFLAAHSTQFTRPGWTFLKHGSGVGKFSKGGVYVALVSPDRKDFTIVIETVVTNNENYDMSPENVTLQLKGSFASITQLNCWYTQLNIANLDDSYLFEKQKPIDVVNGKITLDLGINQVYTLTTLTTGNKGVYPTPPPSRPFPLPYSDDFESYREYEEPYMITPQSGAYEVTTVGGTRGKIMRQMAVGKPVTWSIWCRFNTVGVPLAVIGEYYWSDIRIEMDVFVNLSWDNKTDGVVLAARVPHGGCHCENNTGVYFYFYPETKTYLLSSDFRRRNVISTGPIGFVNADWNKMSLSVQGNTAEGELNGKEVFNISTVPSTVTSGFAALGAASFGSADFDNLSIANITPMN